MLCCERSCLLCLWQAQLHSSDAKLSDCGLYIETIIYYFYRNGGEDLAGALALSSPSVQLCVWYSELMCSVWSRREDKPECPGQG